MRTGLRRTWGNQVMGSQGREYVGDKTGDKNEVRKSGRENRNWGTEEGLEQ